MVEEKTCCHCRYWELIGGEPDRGLCMNDMQYHFADGAQPEDRTKTVNESCENFRKEDA